MSARAHPALARALGLSSAASAAVLALVCCAPTDVVVADVHGALDGGGDSRPFGKSCTVNDDCGPSSFCERTACGDATGVCQVRPTFCDNALLPTCACDGVTFWNDCLRRSRGETAAIPGQCTSGAAVCGNFMKPPCPLEGSSCARLLPPDARCDGPMPPPDMTDGFCWVVPVTCPPTNIMDTKWVPCSGGPPPPPMDCKGYCEAIKDGHPRRQLFTTTCPM